MLFAKETILIAATVAGVKNNSNKKVIFKNCAPFIDFIRETNNAEVDNAKNIDTVKSMYDLIEYSNNCSKTS